MRTLLTKITQYMSPPNNIPNRDKTGTYLSRWYLLGLRRDEEDGHKEVTERKFPVNLFLHCFRQSDDDGALHSHPWDWAVSVILSGGYWEYKRVGDEVVCKRFKPWSINFLRGEDYHRVELLEKDAWSLFLVGKKRTTWYFWSQETKKKAHWLEFLNEKRGGAPANWVDDVREGTNDK